MAQHSNFDRGNLDVFEEGVELRGSSAAGVSCTDLTPCVDCTVSAVTAAIP